MSRERLILLCCLVGFFMIIAGVFSWAKIFDAQQYLPAGSRPPEQTTVEPKLPPIRRSDPLLGVNNSRHLTMVEFADFNCIYCRLSEPQVKAVLAAFGEQIRFVWRDLPLSVDTVSGRLPATAARCALEQQKFWEMHDALFVAARLDRETILRLAQTLGLERSRFESCVDSDRYAKALQDDVNQARRHGILSGPTFFVGSRVISGYVSQTELIQMIQSELSNKR